MIDSLLSFMRARIPLYRAWTDEQMQAVLGFHASRGLLCVVSVSGHVKAMSLARPVSSIEQAKDDHFHIDENGSIAYIDDLILDGAMMLTPIVLQLSRSLGKREYVAFSRGKYAYRDSKYKASRLMRLLPLLNAKGAT